MGLQRADAVGQVAIGGAGLAMRGFAVAVRAPTAVRSRTVSAARIASIGELGPSSAEASRATSAATSLMRSRNSEFSTRSEAQASSVSRFILPRSRASRSRSSRRALQLALQLRLFRLEPLVRGACAGVELGDRGAQVAFGLARGFDLAVDLAELEFALGEQARLLAEPVLQIVGAAAENFGFGGLRRQLLLELADAAAEILDLAALFVQFLRRDLAARAARRRGDLPPP